MRRTIVALLAGAALSAPTGAGAQMRLVPHARPATVAYSFPEECTVLPVVRTPFLKARALLARLGCRARPRRETSGLAKGLVVSVVGGDRSYAFGHVVTLIVSSGAS